MSFVDKKYESKDLIKYMYNGVFNNPFDHIHDIVLFRVEYLYLSFRMLIIERP